MRYLLDTGILLRIVHPVDPRHPAVVAALDVLKAQGHTLHCGIQNIAEFWNVTTRPTTARGGFGQSVQEAEQRLGTVEPLVEVMTESLAS